MDLSSFAEAPGRFPFALFQRCTLAGREHFFDLLESRRQIDSLAENGRHGIFHLLEARRHSLDRETRRMQPSVDLFQASGQETVAPGNGRAAKGAAMVTP